MPYHYHTASCHLYTYYHMQCRVYDLWWCVSVMDRSLSCVDWISFPITASGLFLQLPPTLTLAQVIDAMCKNNVMWSHQLIQCKPRQSPPQKWSGCLVKWRDNGVKVFSEQLQRERLSCFWPPQHPNARILPIKKFRTAEVNRSSSEKQPLR